MLQKMLSGVYPFTLSLYEISRRKCIFMKIHIKEVFMLYFQAKIYGAGSLRIQQVSRKVTVNAEGS